MVKHWLLGVVFALLLPAAAQAESAAPYKAGDQYEVLDYPIPVQDQSKIVVTEVFWYGCPHCYHFRPMIEAWVKTLPTDVEFQMLPAALGRTWTVHAHAFYTEKALGVFDKMHDVLFDALARDHEPLDDENSLAKFFAQHGVDEQKFRQAWESFGVNAEVQQAASKVRGAMITGVPTLLVDGKYKITGESAGSQENMLKVADFLIKKEREARQSKQ